MTYNNQGFIYRSVGEGGGERGRGRGGRGGIIYMQVTSPNKTTSTEHCIVLFCIIL